VDLALAVASLAGALALSVLLWAWTSLALFRRLRALRSAKQSQSTRYGQITEQFAPHLATWPWDPKNFRFIGSPIDGIQFTPDGVVFVEIKSADARLSPLQQEVRRHVEEGRVTWREVRIR
jgi:predicted Holliday junction resolvase-like endonuclease